MLVRATTPQPQANSTIRLPVLVWQGPTSALYALGPATLLAFLRTHPRPFAWLREQGWTLDDTWDTEGSTGGS